MIIINNLFIFVIYMLFNYPLNFHIIKYNSFLMVCFYVTTSKGGLKKIITHTIGHCLLLPALLYCCDNIIFIMLLSSLSDSIIVNATGGINIDWLTDKNDNTCNNNELPELHLKLVPPVPLKRTRVVVSMPGILTISLCDQFKEEK